MFLAFGLLAGEDGLLGIEFDSGPVAYFIGTLALAIILFDSGFETRIKNFRTAGAPAVVLATIGVLLTTLILGAAAHLLFDIGWDRRFPARRHHRLHRRRGVFFLLRAGGIHLRATP